MYANPSFKTKKALKEAVESGRTVTVFSPGGYGTPKSDGIEAVEGPNFEMHRWYAQVTLKDGVIIKVK